MVIFTAVLTFGCVCFGILQVDFFSSFMILVQWKSKTHHISSSPGSTRSGSELRRWNPSPIRRSGEVWCRLAGPTASMGRCRGRLWRGSRVRQNSRWAGVVVAWGWGGPGRREGARASQGHRGGAGRALGDRTPSLLCPELFVKSPSTQVPLEAWPTWRWGGRDLGGNVERWRLWQTRDHVPHL